MAAKTTKKPQKVNQASVIETVIPEVLEKEQDSTILPASTTLKTSSTKRLSELEGLIKKSLKNIESEYQSIAWYLKEIRDNQLYRESYESWKDYIEAKFSFTRRYADYQITFVEVQDNLKKVAEEHNVPLPTSEAQTRSLAAFKDSAERVELWRKGCQISRGKVPSRETMAEVVRTYKAENRQREIIEATNSKKKALGALGTQITEEDYVRILKVESEEDRIYLGYWGIVTEVTALKGSERQYLISLPFGQVEVIDRYPDVPSSSVVKKISFKGAQKKSWKDLHQRLTTIYENIDNDVNADNYPEQIVMDTLEYFGKRKKEITISNLEKNMLSVLSNRLWKKKENVQVDERAPDFEVAEEKTEDIKLIASTQTDQTLLKSTTDTTSSNEPNKSVDNDVRQQLETWRKSSEFATLTGIPQSKIAKFINRNELPEDKTVVSYEYEKLAIEIDVSSKPYQYRALSKELYTYSELIEKHPELATYKTFEKEIKRQDKKIKEFNYMKTRKLKNQYILYQYRFGEGEGLFLVSRFMEKSSPKPNSQPK